MDTSATQTTAQPRQGWAGDFWGGLAAMLVALPSAVAFGVTIFSAIDATSAARGAVAGILGAIVLGMIASTLGGTRRLISAPCAPAAAVLAGAALEFVRQGLAPEVIIALLALIGLFAGAAQILFGVVGIGRLIKYMPYPVVSGYLSGVGLIIILSQVPKFLGAPHGASFWTAVTLPGSWLWQGIAVGTVTMLVMVFAPKVTKAVPATILALMAGLAVYFGVAVADRSLLELTGNPLVVGPLSGSDTGFVESTLAQWASFSRLSLGDFALVLVPGLTLAVLLSIDTLKTCVVLDTLTRSRHDPNRELIGQGVANIASTGIGGVPGAGLQGATLGNISRGAQTRRSGFMAGVLALTVFLLLGKLIAWLPIAALAGILIVIGARMFDLRSLHLLRSRATVLDFMVIATVVVVAEMVSLIAASAVGVGLAVLLFVRAQLSGSNVRRKTLGNQLFSKQVRLPEQRLILERLGGDTVIFELQGSLFFGTTDELYSALEPELGRRTYVILDMRRVQSVDVTAVHVLDLVGDILRERGAFLLFSDLPHSVPSGQNMMTYFAETGVVKPESHARVFEELDDALEWVENRILSGTFAGGQEALLDLADIEIFRGRKTETLDALRACMGERHCAPGDRIFRRGDSGDELFLVRRGTVRIELPISDHQRHHLASFGRGDFFGEMSFLDQNKRSADAVASSDTDLLVLSRGRFDEFAREHRKVAMSLLEGLARVLADRLRYTNAELRQLQAS
ncbi:MAG: SulP family inorganic anion transporter [Opitutus sp.]